jgi:hypothetical protein
MRSASSVKKEDRQPSYKLPGKARAKNPPEGGGRESGRSVLGKSCATAKAAALAVLEVAVKGLDAPHAGIGDRFNANLAKGPGRLAGGLRHLLDVGFLQLRDYVVKPLAHR